MLNIETKIKEMNDIMCSK